MTNLRKIGVITGIAFLAVIALFLATSNQANAQYWSYDFSYSSGYGGYYNSSYYGGYYGGYYSPSYYYGSYYSPSYYGSYYSPSYVGGNYGYNHYSRVHGFDGYVYNTSNNYGYNDNHGHRGRN